MFKRSSLFLFIALLATALLGCGKKDGKDGKGGKKAADKITLEKISDAKMGYEISIPKGAKTLAKGDLGHTYSKVLSDGMMEYNIHLSPMGATSLAAFVRQVTMMGGKKVEQKKAIPGGFLVVKAPQGATQMVWVTKKGKSAKITAKCSGPAKGKDMLVQICTSLKVTK